MTVFFMVIIIGGVSLIVSGIYSVIYKNTEKVDEGFTLNYHKLSYRRRFLRDLWQIPLLILVLFLTYKHGDLSAKEKEIVTVILITIFLISLTNNYTKWKKED